MAAEVDRRRRVLVLGPKGDRMMGLFLAKQLGRWKGKMLVSVSKRKKGKIKENAKEMVLVVSVGLSGRGGWQLGMGRSRCEEPEKKVMMTYAKRC